MRRGEFSVETVFTSFKLDFRARVPGRAFPFILLFARSNQSLFDGELLFGVVGRVAIGAGCDSVVVELPASRRKV